MLPNGFISKDEIMNSMQLQSMIKSFWFIAPIGPPGAPAARRVTRALSYRPAPRTPTRFEAQRLSGTADLQPYAGAVLQ